MKLDSLQLLREAAKRQQAKLIQDSKSQPAGLDEMQTVPFDPALALETLHSEQHNAESQVAEHAQEPSDVQVEELLRAETLRLEDVADTQVDEPTSPPHDSVDAKPSESEVEVVEKPHKPLLEWRGHNSDEAMEYLKETPKKEPLQLPERQLSAQPQDSPSNPPEKLAKSEPVPENQLPKEKPEVGQSRPEKPQNKVSPDDKALAGGDQRKLAKLPGSGQRKPDSQTVEMQDIETTDDVEILAVKQSDRASLLSWLQDMNRKGLSLAQAIEKLTADEAVEAGAIPLTTRMDQFKHKRQRGLDGEDGDAPPSKRPTNRGRGRGKGRGKVSTKGAADEVTASGDEGAGAADEPEPSAAVETAEVATPDTSVAVPKRKAEKKAKVTKPKSKAKAKAKAKASGKKKAKGEAASLQKDSAASLEAVSAEPVETVPDTEDGKKAKAADQLGTEDEQDKKKPGKRPSFARRPVPMTAPASDRWHAIRNVFKEHVQPKILSAGGTVYCWEERVCSHQI